MNAGALMLARMGLSAEQVRRALSCEPLAPAETIRRAAARSVRKLGYGNKGLPAAIVAQMYADYQRLGSCARVAVLYGRTAQAMQQIFAFHGCKLHERPAKLKLNYGGLRYSFSGARGRTSYWHCTTGDRHALHRRLWLEAGGTVPEGWELAFKDGDTRHCFIENLALVRKGTTARRHGERATVSEGLNFSARRQNTNAA
ncbi:HNH endonuclease signature motif containing protein [Oleiharenicola sp. Vm1]|uniref:HNH endonuclease signature motif containing protein n=1 Tax=Oleiharenicola sp. Vm1 TaxID=3398393 RepID=UPI0039F59D42